MISYLISFGIFYSDLCSISGITYVNDYVLRHPNKLKIKIYKYGLYVMLYYRCYVEFAARLTPSYRIEASFDFTGGQLMN